MQILSTCIPLVSLSNIIFKIVLVKVMFTLTVSENLLFEERSVLSPAERSTGSERVKVSVKNQHKYSEIVKITWEVAGLQA